MPVHLDRNNDEWFESEPRTRRFDRGSAAYPKSGLDTATDRLMKNHALAWQLVDGTL